MHTGFFARVFALIYAALKAAQYIQPYKCATQEKPGKISYAGYIKNIW